MRGKTMGFAAAVLLATAAWPAEVIVYGAFYGSLLDDFAEGTQTPVLIPEPPSEEENNTPNAVITRDGDPAVNFRWEADVGVRAILKDNLTGEVLFTFDDRKQSPFYSYDLLHDTTSDTWYLSERSDNRYVYGSLEQVNVGLKNLFWATDVTVGGFDIRYGHGGYYNEWVNRLDPTSFVAYLDPFGVRLSKNWKGSTSTLEVGAGLQRQIIVAASHRWHGWGFFGAMENLTYDFKTLWDGHFAASLPKSWRYFYYRQAVLAQEPVTSLEPSRQSYHFGAEWSWNRPWLDFYAVGAYHLFPDSPTLGESPTGGNLFQFYPDFGVRVLAPRVWLRGAALWERWQANYDAAFGEATATTEYLLVFAEPQYHIREGLFVGLGGRYVNPHRAATDDPLTYVRENQTLSVALIPHLRYTPADEATIDVSYEYVQWDPTYDLTATSFKEDRYNLLKVEIGATF